mmetsp:Transcript_7164/g.20123  ORF Transcript_7164/g.20123 Transcript_7164/m.20123 type:complete len:201 (-) Transcript_7164:104-706(-)
MVRSSNRRQRVAEADAPRPPGRLIPHGRGLCRRGRGRSLGGGAHHAGGRGERAAQRGGRGGGGRSADLRRRQNAQRNLQIHRGELLGGRRGPLLGIFGHGRELGHALRVDLLPQQPLGLGSGFLGSDWSLDGRHEGQTGKVHDVSVLGLEFRLIHPEEGLQLIHLPALEIVETQLERDVLLPELLGTLELALCGPVMTTH